MCNCVKPHLGTTKETILKSATYKTKAGKSLLIELIQRNTSLFCPDDDWINGIDYYIRFNGIRHYDTLDISTAEEKFNLMCE